MTEADEDTHGRGVVEIAGFPLLWSWGKACPALGG